MLDITYWCNRSGALAASQFPLITALGTKNNAVSCMARLLVFYLTADDLK